MEQFKTKKPSRFNTWCAMATFRLCDAEIEEQHHCNLIQGKGCSRKQFGRFPDCNRNTCRAVSAV